MKNLLLTVDSVGQAILISLCLFFPLTFFFALPLGGWQLLSSFFKGLLLRSRIHFFYFLSATAYCVLLIFSAQMELDYEWLGWGQYLWIILAAPPIVGAVWYFFRSMADLKEAGRGRSELVQ